MTIPVQVQKQQEEASKALEELQAKLAAEKAEKEALVTGLPMEPVAAPAVAPASESETVSRAEYDALKARHDSLKGRLESSGMRGLQSERDKAVSVLEQTKQEIAAMKAQLAELVEARRQQAPERPAHLKYVKDEEIADLNPDALERQARMMRGVAEEVLAPLRGEVKRETESVRRVQSERELKATWDEVEQTYPGARQFNDTDAEFNAFLGQIDPDDIDGREYGEIGSLALKRGNARGVKRIIKAYLDASGTEWPESAAAVAAGLGRREQPAKSRASGVQRVDGSKPTFRQSDVEAHVTEYTKGLWRGRETEWKKKKDMFDEAMEEGRVVLGI